MDFMQFLQLLPKIQNESLPGEDAHLKMAPPERRQLMQNLIIDNLDARNAAVMLLFYPRNGKTNFVLILRNAYKGVHSSQVAFPGGKKETGDETTQMTALRETYEEVGVLPEHITVVRELTRIYIPPSNFIVYPYLGYSTQELIFTPDPREVAGIIEVGLDDFLDENNLVGMTRSTSYAANTSVPGFQMGEHVVWGATAMILSEFKELLNRLI
jgi:8-oxo-dGTP pyrophosphatase MutT (NUDIX family)